MADQDTQRLKKILTETYRNQARDKRVKDAMKKRVKDKKAQKKGVKLDKVTSHNLKTSLSSAARAAADRKHTGAGSDKVGKAKPKAEGKAKKKTNVFGLGKAVKNILQMKDRGY